MSHDTLEAIQAICNMVTAVGVPLLAIVATYVAFKIRNVEAQGTKTAEKVEAVADKVETTAQRTATAAVKADHVAIIQARENTVKMQKLDTLLVAADKNQTTTEHVQELVNGKMAQVLQSVAELAEWKAAATGNAIDIKAAANARIALEEHNTKVK